MGKGEGMIWENPHLLSVLGVIILCQAAVIYGFAAGGIKLTRVPARKNKKRKT
jgi:hypothetical protein